MELKEIKIYYIAGYSRSGSTLLDILIGSANETFSCGEICFLPENGIRDNEFCSCGKLVNDCIFWKQVIHRWNKVRTFSNEEYINIYKKYFRNKRLFLFLWRIYFPNVELIAFFEDTKRLYKIIWQENHNKIIVDSSKSPYVLLMLKKIGFNVTTIHIVRNLRGVLFSTSKFLESNPSDGVEKDIVPRSKANVILTWVLTNSLIFLFAKGTNLLKISYDKLLSDPFTTLKAFSHLTFSDPQLFHFKGPFFPGHLVAGGRVRMKKEIFIEENLMKDENIQLGKVIDFLCRSLDKIFK
jgi:hypothetical protein